MSTRSGLAGENLLHKEKVYGIIGAAIEVHKELGPGFLESVYQEAMEIELRTKYIPFHSQARLGVFYKGRKLTKEFLADFVCYGCIVVELKCIPCLTKTEEAQILNYMKATRMEVGLLINFGSKGKLEWRRYILSA